MAQTCNDCKKFFSRFQCNSPDDECDCPKCQGFCTCDDEVAPQPRLLAFSFSKFYTIEEEHHWTDAEVASLEKFLKKRA